jgi:retron-type reverse transcriptase
MRENRETPQSPAGSERAGGGCGGKAAEQGGAYRARPSRRTWIDKVGCRKRPLGLVALEDKAGVMEQEQCNETEEGSPEGSVISPILANLYLHYALDLWVKAWRK